MDQREKNKLKMYQTVKAVCTAHQAAWIGLPAFSTAYAQFTAQVSALEAAAYEQGTVTVGVKAGKDQLFEDTVDRAYVISKALKAYAVATHQTTMTEQTSVGKHQYKRGGAQQALILIDRMLHLATINVSHLGDYGITQLHIDELAAFRQQLGENIGMPRTAIVDRKLQTATIDHLFAIADALLKQQLDGLAEVLKTDQPGFWQTYNDARIIVGNKGKTNGDSGVPGDLTGEPPHGGNGTGAH